MNDNKFEYTYSSKEQEEVKRIREKYSQKAVEQPNKMEQLRRLDESVTRKATSKALVVGIIGAIIMGTGMSLVMTDLGSSLGTVASTVIGIVTGIVGMVGVALAYPLYNRTIKKERKRIAPEIIRLTDELMK